MNSKSFNRLIEYLGSTRDGGPPTITRFREFNFDEIANDLDLDERGRARAADDRSVARVDGLDEAEMRILDRVKGEARRSDGEYHAALDLYEARLRAASVDMAAMVLIKAAGEEGVTNCKAQLEEDRLPLKVREDSARRVIAEFEDFVNRNDLHTTAPEVVDLRARTTGLWWIGLLMVAETVANGLFFSEGSEFGLVGGVAEAFFLSVLNTALAGIFGLVAIRYARHVRWSTKLPAIVLIFTCIALALALNLLVAHYREAFVNSSGRPDFRDVIAGVAAHPLVLSDAKSWLLGLVGLVIFGIASVKFHGLDDRYPGFGRVARRRLAALKELGEARADCIQQLSDHRTYAVGVMQEVVEAISARKWDFEVALHSRDRLLKEYVMHVDALRALLARLVARYRSHFGGSGPSLESNIETPSNLPDVFTRDTSAHDQAINEMSSYIDAISTDYIHAVQEVGAQADLKAFGVVYAAE